MLQTTNFNQANVCALYNKGVNARAIALDFLTSKNEKKIVNYLVIPNNCVLSLSLVEQAKIIHFFFSRTRARSVPQTL